MSSNKVILHFPVEFDALFRVLCADLQYRLQSVFCASGTNYSAGGYYKIHGNYDSKAIRRKTIF